MKGSVGSPVYMAPEILDDHPYNTSADVYSFSIVLWELVTRKIPYAEQKFRRGAPGLFELYQFVVTNQKRPPPPSRDECPPKLIELIQQCWDPDPAKRPTFQQILESHIFDEVMVEEMFSDANELGRIFWKQFFTTKEEIREEVPWKEFAKNFVAFIGLSLPKDKLMDDVLEWKCLKMVLADERTDMVKIDRFADALEWFGPLKKGDKFLIHLMKTCKIKGFYGDVSSREAANLMAGKREGTYIIRFSSQEPGFFTLTSVSKKNTLENFRIKHKAGTKYSLAEQEFPTISKLRKHFKDELCLKYPMRGSKYAQLFVDYKVGGTQSNYVEIKTE